MKRVIFEDELIDQNYKCLWSSALGGKPVNDLMIDEKIEFCIIEAFNFAQNHFKKADHSRSGYNITFEDLLTEEKFTFRLTNLKQSDSTNLEKAMLPVLLVMYNIFNANDEHQEKLSDGLKKSFKDEEVEKILSDARDLQSQILSPRLSSNSGADLLSRRAQVVLGYISENIGNATKGNITNPDQPVKLFAPIPPTHPKPSSVSSAQEDEGKHYL